MCSSRRRTSASCCCLLTHCLSVNPSDLSDSGAWTFQDHHWFSSRPLPVRCLSESSWQRIATGSLTHSHLGVCSENGKRTAVAVFPCLRLRCHLQQFASGAASCLMLVLSSFGVFRICHNHRIGYETTICLPGRWHLPSTRKCWRFD